MAHLSGKDDRYVRYETLPSPQMLRRGNGDLACRAAVDNCESRGLPANSEVLAAASRCPGMLARVLENRL